MKTLAACAVIALALCAARANPNARLKLTVHTTSGCLDTVWFIQTQLMPVYREFGDLIDLQFVPWGRTVRGADDALTCQFGVADCWANRAHRCALKLLPHQPARAHYMNCEFRDFTDRPAFQDGSYACARASGLLVKDVDLCVGSEAGDQLAAEAQANASVPMQIINFVPAIVLDDAPHALLHSMAFQDLRSTLCSVLSQDPTAAVDC